MNLIRAVPGKVHFRYRFRLSTVLYHCAGPVLPLLEIYFIGRLTDEHANSDGVAKTRAESTLVRNYLQAWMCFDRELNDGDAR